jgi:fatty acid desaturase
MKAGTSSVAAAAAAAMAAGMAGPRGQGYGGTLVVVVVVVLLLCQPTLVHPQQLLTDAYGNHANATSEVRTVMTPAQVLRGTYSLVYIIYVYYIYIHTYI